VVCIIEVGNAVILARKLVSFLCLAAVLFAALAPASPGLLWAVVIPLLLLVGTVAVVASVRPDEGTAPPSLPYLDILTARAPPAL
jgi:hypothetical protein